MLKGLLFGKPKQNGSQGDSHESVEVAEDQPLELILDFGYRSWRLRLLLRFGFLCVSKNVVFFWCPLFEDVL